MKTIKLGDPQPEQCKHCGIQYGYKVTDAVKGFYDSHYNENGEYEGGSYGDTMRTTRKYKMAICLNCNGNLNLKVDRS